MNINLSQRDIDYIARVVDTEVPRSIARRDPVTYNRMVAAVVDTITNRMASDRFPNTAEEVVNQNRQFSKITGPARLAPYGSVRNAPIASEAAFNAVTEHLTTRAQGAPSSVGGALHYANPHYSDRRNLSSWINPMIQGGATKVGLGRDIHYHGTAPGFEPAPEYALMVEGIPALPETAPIPTPAPDRTYAAPSGEVERVQLAALDQPPIMTDVLPTPAPRPSLPAPSGDVPTITARQAEDASMTALQPSQPPAPAMPSVVAPAAAAEMPSGITPPPVSARAAEEDSLARLAGMNAGKMAGVPAVEAASPTPDPNAALVALPGQAPIPTPRPTMAPPLPEPIEISATPQVFDIGASQPQATAPEQSIPSGMHAISALFGGPEGAMAVSRSNPDISFRSMGDGRVQKTNQFGHVQTLRPGDYSHPTTPGPQAETYIPDPNEALSAGGLSREGKKKSDEKNLPSIGKIAGAVAGAALGNMLAGPIGGAVGSRIGASVGDKGFGGAAATARTNLINSPLGRLFAGSFPEAPKTPSRSTRSDGSGPSYDEMRSISPGAASAISSGKAGLY